MRFEFEKISKYRSELFGFAILSILLVHYAKDVQTTKSAVSYIASVFAKYYRGIIRSQGVDIFIFLSGLGLYYSIQNKNTMYEFYKKRLLRVLIPYLITMPAFLFFIDFIVHDQSISAYISHLTYGSFWFGNGSSYTWFIALILLLYISFPFIYEMVNTERGHNVVPAMRGTKDSLRNVILLVAICYLLLISCKNCNYKHYNQLELALARIPVFIIGVYYGGKSYQKKKASKPEFMFLLSGVFIMFIYFINMLLVDLDLLDKTVYMRFVEKYFKTVFRSWAGIGLMIIMVYFFELAPKIISCFFNFFSNITLELYIMHEIMRKLFKIAKLPIYKFWCYCLAMLLAWVFALLVHRLSNTILSKIAHHD